MRVAFLVTVTTLAVARADRARQRAIRPVPAFDRASGGTTETLPVPSYAVASDGNALWIIDVFGRLERRTMP
jgi:hypothetical protein